MEKEKINGQDEPELFQDDELYDEIEESEEKEPAVKRKSSFGVIAMQTAVSLVAATLMILLLTYSKPIGDSMLNEVKDKAANDFSFREQVYSTIGEIITYLNEIRPVGQPIDGNLSAQIQTDASAATEPDITEPAEDEPGTDEPAKQTEGEEQDGIGGEYIPSDGITMPANATFAPVKFTGKIVFPLKDNFTVTSSFGFREHPITKINEFHNAADIAAAEGEPVMAAACGMVIESEESGALGKHIVIDHGKEFYTIYGHCSSLEASAGTRVRSGETIAKVGSSGDSTGSHLHFSMKKNGLYFDPSYIFECLK